MAPQSSYSDRELTQAVASSQSWRDLRSLGLKSTSASAICSIRRHEDHLQIDDSYFTGQRRWTGEQLEDAVSASRDWREETGRLGIHGGSAMTTAKGHAARLGLTTERFGKGLTSDVDLVPSPKAEYLYRARASLAAGWLALAGYEVSWPLEPLDTTFLLLPKGMFVASR